MSRATPGAPVSIAPEGGRGGIDILEKPVARETLWAALTRAGLAASAHAVPRILVADDDPAMVEILAIYLDHAGYAVLRAGGGAAAIAMARSERPDGLLLDLMMPEVSGFDVVDALRADPATAALPILILSGLALTPGELQRLERQTGSVIDKRGFGQGQNRGAAAAPAVVPSFRDLVETSRDWVWQINDLGIFSYCSPQVERLLGYRPDELAGRSRFDLMPEGEAVRMARLFAQRASARQPVELVESAHRHKDGRRIFLETGAMPFFDPAGNYLGYRGIDRDVTARRLAEDRLRASERAVRELSAHLERVREEEKAAIAREIHDELGGTLAAIGVDAHWLAERLGDDPAARARLTDMTRLSESAVRTLRRIVTELRPTVLDDLGLFAAIEWQVDEFRRRTGIDCRLGIACDEEPPETRAIVLFRLMQESLTNVMRHAAATRVDVELWAENDRLILEIADNGRGLPADALERPGAHGLRGMRERVRHLGGTLDIGPTPGGGVTLRASLPPLTD